MTTASEFADITNRRIATNGIELNIAEQGDPDAPLILLLHGFPESWFSWRHQFAPLAAAGYHVAAPDMRGYGDSDKPGEISAYNQIEVANDIKGLVGALGYSTAIVIGHDWGAPTAWNCALWHADTFTAVGALSVPYSPRSPVPPLDAMQAFFAGKFFYQLYFQTPGVAEAEFEADVRTALRKFYHLASGEMDLNTYQEKSEHDDMLTSLIDPAQMGAWLSDRDLDFYVDEFSRSGFAGPLNYYRNHNLTWELSADRPTEIRQPALFVAGERDGVIAMAGPALENMPTFVTDLRTNVLIPKIGHWTQQEDPRAVNAHLLDWLQGLG